MAYVNPWTLEKTAELRGLAPLGLSAPEMAAKLGREFTADMVRGKLHRLGLARTRAEAAKLMAKGAQMTAAKMMAGRPNAWSAGEERFLRANADKMTAAEIGQHLGKTEKAVYRRAGILRINFTKPRPRTPFAKFTAKTSPLTRDRISADEGDLVARFMAERGVTRCPPMAAFGSIVPTYIGKSKRAA